MLAMPRVSVAVATPPSAASPAASVVMGHPYLMSDAGDQPAVDADHTAGGQEVRFENYALIALVA